jgi:hypothetical protein
VDDQALGEAKLSSKRAAGVLRSKRNSPDNPTARDITLMPEIVAPVALVNNRAKFAAFEGPGGIMKIARSVLPLLVALVMASAALPAQEKQPLSPPGKASVKFDDGETVTIKYSRPSM